MADTANKTNTNTSSSNKKKGPELVYVKLNGVSWTRHDVETGKTTVHRQGAKFWITKEEYDVLTAEHRPRLGERLQPVIEETEEDDDNETEDDS